MSKSAFGLILLSSLLLVSGCPEDHRPRSDGNEGLSGGAGCVYGASGLRIAGLTTLVPDPEDNFTSEVEVYIDLVDSFGYRIKAPGIFRLELYEFVARSGQSKGKRLFIWPDIDLTDADDNNEHWQDYLRVYVFNLKSDFRAVGGTEYILHATFLTGDERRLIDTLQIKAGN